MDEQQRISVVSSSSNSSSMVSSKTYDVFLSFRGEDTRRNFTSHLYKALNEKKVKTYIDDNLEKGDEISPALIKAIEDSHVSIVIFSENYASSKWCLGELSKILECQKEKGLIVIPVFYNIDPSDVRKQAGSYEQAFAEHEGEPSCIEWKDALTKAANLARWDSRTYRTDPELLKDIVEGVLQKLPPRFPNQPKGMVGIQENIKHIESLLSEVKILGIWGMGGIGKTTLATALYNKLSDNFEGHCFLTNVREKSDNLKDFCDEIRNLRGKKAFIVLDDVATSEQLEKLIKDYDFWELGSKVIVTTRNKQIFRPHDKIYPVQELSSDHSLQLFCLTAFGEKDQPKDGYEDLSRRVISYCQGIPLALKVLGASLRGRSKEAWECQLRKLQEIPKMQLLNVLKLSYDGIDDYEKNIFLDIACFFKGENKDWVTRVLEAFDFYPVDGIEALLDKALIRISHSGEIEMHDLIQEMGQQIVHQKSKDPGRRSRLWRSNDVLYVLKNNKGTDVVEGIILDLYTLTEDLYLSPSSLAKMTKLRFLQIHRGYWRENRFEVYLPNGLDSLSNELRYLHWDSFSLESLPPNFCAEQLVMLHMTHSKLKKLWDGVQNLVNLKTINLYGSRDLIEIPDLSKAEQLESVCLVECEKLHQFHPSKLSFPKLTYVDLQRCREIESINVHSKSLSEILVIGCFSLKEFSVTSERMTQLDLSHTAIHALSSSMLSLPKLTILCLNGCKRIERVDVHSKYLCVLRLNGCSSLKEISLTSEEITEMDLSHTDISALMSSILPLPKLTNLRLRGCKRIQRVDVHSKSLCKLDLYGCSSLKEISVTSEEITELDLFGCREVESLIFHSKSLCVLNLGGLSSLREITVTSEKMWNLKLSHADIRALPSSIGDLLSIEVLDLSGTNVEILPANVKNLSMLRELWLNDCKKLMSLSELPPSLEELGLENCWELTSLPELPPSLKNLWLDDCRKLVCLSKLPLTMSVVRALNCIALGTEITQRLVLQHMLQSRIPYLHQQYFNNHIPMYSHDGYFIFPGDNVTNSECGFHTTKRSITIPYLPKSHLCGFIYYCIILSEGQHLNVWDDDGLDDDDWDDDVREDFVSVYIHQDDIEVCWGTICIEYGSLISKHVVFSYVDVNQFDRISEACDHFNNITFKFEREFFKEKIKGCGVFQVYATASGLKLVSSSKKIGIGVGVSNNENEQDPE